MAGDWIKIEENMPDKPEVQQMAAVLGIDPDAVAGKLIRVWVWATRNCNADGVTSVTVRPLLDRITSVTGFADAMLKVGWLTVSGDTMLFTNFDRHSSQTAKQRAATKDRVARHRVNKCNAASVTEALPEKRREESNTPIVPNGDVAIYEAYPRKVGRDAALKAIAKAQKQLPAAELLAKVKAYAAATARWSDDDRKFIPHPATWFHRGSYHDDPATWTRNTSAQPEIRTREIDLS
jgi:hypothetical protein